MKTVLLVDDSETLLTQTKEKLSDEYQVLIASSGNDGFKVIESCEKTIDLLLLDLNLPDLDGISMLRKIKQACPAKLPPTLLVTAHCPPDLSQNKTLLKDLGIKGILIKPTPEIKECVSQFFGMMK